MNATVPLTREAVAAWVAERRDEIIQLLCDMIAVDSVTGNEGPMAELCAQWLRDHDIEAILQPAKDRFNTIGIVGNGDTSSDTLILSGHLDTVPPNDAPWTYGPWTPTVTDDKVFGLGASDLHASIVGAYYAQHFIQSQGLDLPGRLVSAFTIEEETTGDGTIAFMDWAEETKFLDPAKTVAVVTEPTDMDHMCLGNLASSFLILKVEGLGGHGSRPHLAKNPLPKLMSILKGFEEMQARWAGLYGDPDFGNPTCTPTSVQAGDLERTNVIPQIARAILDCRPTPPLYADDLKLFRSEVAALLAEHEEDGFTITMEELYPREGQKLDREHPIAQTVWKVITEDLGKADAEFRYNPAGNDAVFLAQRGIATVNKIGPGHLKMAHAVDEYCAIENLLAGVELYLWIALRHFGLVK